MLKYIFFEGKIVKTISIKLRVILYILAFILTAAITFLNMGGTSAYKKETQSAMNSASLPIVYMTTESGINYNYLHGYTCDVEQKLIHDSITPISSDRTFDFNIKQYGSRVTGISFEVRNLDGSKLIERSGLEDYEPTSGDTTASLKFKNLLDVGEEYMLKITLSMEYIGDADYYTRIVIMDDAEVDCKISYVNNFSSYTLDDDQLENVTAKLEPDGTGDNTNLGRVNIHSKLSQVGFGQISPELTSDRYITLNEIDGTVASLTVKYTLETGGDDVDASYNVKEFYRINQPDETVTYVYSFDRWMDQIFDPENGLSSTGELYLGIGSDEEVEMKASNSGRVTCFVQEDCLWKYSIVTNQFTELFSFSEEDSDGIRENYDEHDIRILEVSDDGNVKFMVYGYMNRGTHEGKLGISVCQYDAEANTTTEIAFIPREDTYMSIAQDIETLSYINDDNILYMYSNETLYYMNCDTKECMVVADEIIADSCMMCDSNNILMYQVGDSAYNCDVVKVLYLETGEQYDINAASDEKIMALGFINGNIVYGLAKKDRIEMDADGNVNFPMYGIYLVDSDKNIIKEYEPENLCILNVEFDENKITIERGREDSDGNYISVDEDILLSNSQESAYSLKITTRATDIRQKENYLSLITSGTSGKTSYKSTSYVFSDDSVVSLVEMEENGNNYYAYGYGCLYKVTSSLAEAVLSASESGGVVVDDEARIIWSRYKSSEHTLNVSQSLITKASNTQVAATNFILKYSGIGGGSKDLYSQGYTTTQVLDELVGEVYNLTGSTIDLAAYFIDQGYPIIAKTGANQYEIVYGYSASNVATIDFSAGTTKNYTISNFNSTIATYGSVLITAKF